MGANRERHGGTTDGGEPAIPAPPLRWRPRFPAGMAIVLAVSLVLFAGFWLLDTAYFGRRTAAAEPLGAWRLLVESPGANSGRSRIAASTSTTWTRPARKSSTSSSPASL